MTNYQGMFHYENNILKFFATAEGYVNVTTGGRQGPDGPSYVFSYIYNYTDHLGNIRVSYTNNGINAAIIEENHYYPFGLKHKKYGSVDKDLVCVNEDCYEIGIDVVPPQARKSYQYKVQNKEWQDELGLNLYDFHARLFDPAINRTLTIDPKSEMFYSMSPYSFLNNSPLITIDPDGKMSIDGLDDWIKNLSTGEVKWFSGIGNEAMMSAQAHWNMYGSQENLQNLGRSFFGTTSNNISDSSQMYEQRISYLSDVASRLDNNTTLNVEGRNISFPNTVTFEYLSNKFLTTTYDKIEHKNSFGKLAQDLWTLGGGVYFDNLVQKKVPNSFLKLAVPNVLDALLTSETLNGGTNRMAKEKAIINHKKEEHLNNITKKLLTSETLFLIGLRKF